MAEKKKEAGQKEETKEKKPADGPVLPAPKQPDSTLPEKKEPKPTDSSLPENAKVFTIPLRKAFRKKGNKKKNYAVSLIADFLRRNMNVPEVRIGKHLNEKLWKNLPRRVRVKAVVEDGTVKAELFGFDYSEFKALPKQEKAGGMREKLMGRLGPKAMKKQEEEKMVEQKKQPEAAKKEEKREVPRE